jgi:hypothetical protein
MGTVNKKKCFVIMPFSKTKSCSEDKWTEIFAYIIKPAVEGSGLGYACERSVAERENIIKGILDALNKANVVIADLTDNNPNVFYELGVRHTLTNRTILIAQGEKHIPFDLKPYPVAFYSESPAKIAEFKKVIKKKLEDIELNPDRSDNPVGDFLKERNIELLSYEKKANLKKLAALGNELHHNTGIIGDILNIIKESEETRKKQVGRFRFSAYRLSNVCLQLLISTSYILLPPELIKTIISTNGEVVAFNNELYLWSQPEHALEMEKFLKERLPGFQQTLLLLSQRMSEISGKYNSDNYVEPEAPTIVR